MRKVPLVLEFAAIMLLAYTTLGRETPRPGLKFIGCADEAVLAVVYNDAMSHLQPEQVPLLTVVHCNDKTLSAGSIHVTKQGGSAELALPSSDEASMASASAHLAVDIAEAHKIAEWAKRAYGRARKFREKRGKTGAN